MRALLTSGVLTLMLSISACATHRPRCDSRLTPINSMPPHPAGIGSMPAGQAARARRS